MQAARPQRTEAEARERAEENRRRRAEETRRAGRPSNCVKVETPEEFAAYDPTLNALIGRVFTTDRIEMDVFHAKRVRPVTCAANSPPDAS